MAHLITSVIVALISAVAVYVASGSFILAFAAYVGAGMTVLIAVLLAAAFEPAEESQLRTA